MPQEGESTGATECCGTEPYGIMGTTRAEEVVMSFTSRSHSAFDDPGL